MKTSQLIEFLKKRMEKDGDLDVMFYDTRGVEAPDQFKITAVGCDVEPSTMEPTHFYLVGTLNFDGKLGFQ